MENLRTLSKSRKKHLFFNKFIKGSQWNATLAKSTIQKCRQWEKNWLLRMAIKYRKINIISFIMMHGVKINIMKHSRRQTAIHIAEENGFYEAVDVLLEFQDLWFIPNPTDVNGKSHFHIACKRNKCNIIKRMLLENPTMINTSFQVNNPTEPNTPLHIAVFHQFSEVVTLLLENGADPNVQNLFGTPMHWIFRFGHLEIYNVHEAYGGTKIVKLLCEAGFQHDSVDSVQNTVLTLAFISLKNLACEKHLVSSNTKRIVLLRIKDRLKHLLKYDKKSNCLSINCSTWHWISTWNKRSLFDENLFSYFHHSKFVTEIVELFTEHNLRLKVDGNIYSDPPVLIAAHVYNYELFSVLLKKRADVSQFSFQWLADIELRTADTMLNVICMYYLLKQHGWKPIDAYREELTILRYLLKAHNLAKYKAAGAIEDLFVEENVFYTLDGLGLLSNFDLINIDTQKTCIILFAKNLKPEDENLKKLMVQVKDEELTNLSPLQRAIDQELRRAKQVKFLNQISVYDFCMSDVDQCFYLNPADLWWRVNVSELSEEFPIFKRIIKTCVVKKLVRGYSRMFINLFQQRLIETGHESKVESCTPVKNMTNADILHFCETNFAFLNISRK